MRHIVRIDCAVCGTRACTSSNQPKLAQFLVIDKQFARHGTLVTEHVNHETQRTQAVAQSFKECFALVGVNHIADQQPLDRIAHSQYGK